MLDSTRVRAAIVVAALIGAGAGYRWWTSPERQIHRILGDAASALSHEGPETDVRTLTSMAALQGHLAPDVSIDLGRSSGPVRGRPDALALAARLRAATPMLRVQFFDADIALSGEAAATTRVTVQVTMRGDATDEEVAAAHVVLMALARSEGRWVVTSAQLVQDGESTR